ncbi:MAG TPA: hypothetical protein VFF30_18185 [Nitrososphaerales archaeon]|nr:hypothetical protein [Nitrososphaerales archaeon]
MKTNCSFLVKNRRCKRDTVSISILAILGAVTGLGATSVATGDASTAIEAAKQIGPHGLQIALAHVPSWTHAHQVLTDHLSQYAQNGSIGAGVAGGIGAAFRKGLAHAGKALFHLHK